jgi:hypothetical protein
VQHDRLERDPLDQLTRLKRKKLHPHAFRHSCGVQLRRRTPGNLRAAQEHLRHQDVQTTTIYTRLTQHELEQIVSVFDGNGKGVLFGAKTSCEMKVVTPAGSAGYCTVPVRLRLALAP